MQFRKFLVASGGFRTVAAVFDCMFEIGIFATKDFKH
jgi:hypothetical protein